MLFEHDKQVNLENEAKVKNKNFSKSLPLSCSAISAAIHFYYYAATCCVCIKLATCDHCSVFPRIIIKLIGLAQLGALVGLEWTYFMLLHAHYTHCAFDRAHITFPPLHYQL